VSVKEDVLKEMDLSTADAAGGADVGKK
jgi:hypothetical protein